MGHLARVMKITYCSSKNIADREKISCPACHCTLCRSHSSYSRKGFHRQSKASVIEIRVQRYLCLNEDCPRCSFSVLPPMVLPYCRFFWPSLLVLRQALASGSTFYHLAQHVWYVGRRVIVRAAALLNRLDKWVGQLYQEVSDGVQAGELGFMVKIVTRKLGRIELIDRWYCHRYPKRFSHKNEHHTIQLYSVNN